MAPPHHGTGKGAHRRGRSPAGQGRGQGKRAHVGQPHPRSAGRAVSERPGPAVEGGPTHPAQARPFRRGRAQRPRPTARPFRRGRAQAPPTQRRPGRFGEARPSGRGRAHPRSAGEAVSERPSPAVKGSPIHAARLHWQRHNLQGPAKQGRRRALVLTLAPWYRVGLMEGGPIWCQLPTPGAGLPPGRGVRPAAECIKSYQNLILQVRPWWRSSFIMNCFDVLLFAWCRGVMEG